VSNRKPKDLLGIRDRPLSKTHPLTEWRKCDLETMTLIGYKPAIPKPVWKQHLLQTDFAVGMSIWLPPLAKWTLQPSTFMLKMSNIASLTCTFRAVTEFWNGSSGVPPYRMLMLTSLLYRCIVCIRIFNTSDHRCNTEYCCTTSTVSLVFTVSSKLKAERPRAASIF